MLFLNDYHILKMYMFIIFIGEIIIFLTISKYVYNLVICISEYGVC